MFPQKGMIITIREGSETGKKNRCRIFSTPAAILDKFGVF